MQYAASSLRLITRGRNLLTSDALSPEIEVDGTPKSGHNSPLNWTCSKPNCDRFQWSVKGIGIERERTSFKPLLPISTSNYLPWALCRTLYLWWSQNKNKSPDLDVHWSILMVFGGCWLYQYPPNDSSWWLVRCRMWPGKAHPKKGRLRQSDRPSLCWEVGRAGRAGRSDQPTIIHGEKIMGLRIVITENYHGSKSTVYRPNICWLLTSDWAIRGIDNMDPPLASTTGSLGGPVMAWIGLRWDFSRSGADNCRTPKGSQISRLHCWLQVPPICERLWARSCILQPFNMSNYAMYIFVV